MRCGRPCRMQMDHPRLAWALAPAAGSLPCLP